MHLTQFSDYSLRLLLYLAEHDDRSCTIGEIAAWYDISKAHLVKAAHALATLGFVKSFQGRGGGLSHRVGHYQARARRIDRRGGVLSQSWQAARHGKVDRQRGR